MTRYSYETIEEIRSRLDIVDVISRYVTLKERGSSYFGLCPFHTEKTPSFSVSRDKQVFYCFGCGEGGNIYNFIMDYYNLSFKEAVKLLAEEAGVNLKEESTPIDREKKRIKDRLLEIYKETAIFYHNILKEEAGKKAYTYLKERKLSDNIIVKFGLGYSIPKRDKLYNYLKEKGFTNDEILKSTLLSYSEKYGFSDTFYNRVMFPIMDENSRVVGFGGRVMGDALPKYLNSKDTPIFSKRHLLYGMNIARKTKENYFILCEGYMDVITLHEKGFDNAIASLGTALSDENADRLKRYDKKIYLSYDSDAAGIKAKLRAIDIFIKRKVNVKVIDMLPYKDPDEFIKNLGKDEYIKRIENAMNGFMYSIFVNEKNYNLDDPAEKTLFYKFMAKRVLIFKEAIERNNYIEEICKKYDISYDMFNDLIKEELKKYTDRENIGLSNLKRSYNFTNKKSDKDGIIESEKLLLSYLLNDKAIYDRVKDFIIESDFTSEINKEIFIEIKDKYDKNTDIDIQKIIDKYSYTNDHQKVVEVLKKEDALAKGIDKNKILPETLIKIKKHSFDRENSAISSSDPNLFKKKKKDKEFLKKLKDFNI